MISITHTSSPCPCGLSFHTAQSLPQTFERQVRNTELKSSQICRFRPYGSAGQIDIDVLVMPSGSATADIFTFLREALPKNIDQPNQPIMHMMLQRR